MKLTSRSAAPTSSTTDSMTSETIRTWRNRPPWARDVPRELSFRCSTTSAREACSAGNRPVRIVQSKVTTPVNASARQFSAIVAFAGNCEATTGWSAQSAQSAISVPSTPAAIE